MKKAFFAALLALGSIPLFAAGEVTVNAPDFSGLITALTTWVTSFMPVLIGVIAAFAGIWLVRLGWGMIKSISNKSK